MIRTGYLRWEIDVLDRPHPQDRNSGEILFTARPTNRKVRIRWKGPQYDSVMDDFRIGEATLQEVERARKLAQRESVHTIDDVGPHCFRYSRSDRERLPAFWLNKIRAEISTFAHEVVRAAAKIPQLSVSSPSLRAGYARMVEWETMRVIEGKSEPDLTDEKQEIVIEGLSKYDESLPELVAAELVRDVFSAEEFSEFAVYNRVTVFSRGKWYRISRKTHGLVEVWDEAGMPLARLCVVFRDPGMPPSDEVVMKYLLARHDPDVLWRTGNRMSPPGRPLPIPKTMSRNSPRP